jgi:hypothetical protein
MVTSKPKVKSRNLWMGPYPGTKISRSIVGDSSGIGLLDEIFPRFYRGNADSRMLLIPIFYPMVLEPIKDEVRCTVRDSNLKKFQGLSALLLDTCRRGVHLYIICAMLDLSLEYFSQEAMAANTIQISNVGQNSVCEGWKDAI